MGSERYFLSAASLSSAVHTPSSDTIPGTKPTTRTRRLPSHREVSEAGTRAMELNTTAQCRLQGKRYAQPAYGVPSGPFSSTCQNDTSSGNTQRKSLGANCKPLAAVYRGANGCCALTYLRMAILQSRDADSWNMIGPVRMLMITMSITDNVGENRGLCLHNLSTFDMNYWQVHTSRSRRLMRLETGAPEAGE